MDAEKNRQNIFISKVFSNLRSFEKFVPNIRNIGAKLMHERILSFFMMDIGEYHLTFREIARQYLLTCEARREIMPVNSDE